MDSRPTVTQEDSISAVSQTNSSPAQKVFLPAGPQKSSLPGVNLKDSQSAMPPKSGKIVGGSSVDRGEFPFMVSLMHHSSHYHRR